MSIRFQSADIRCLLKIATKNTENEHLIMSVTGVGDSIELPLWL